MLLRVCNNTRLLIIFMATHKELRYLKQTFGENWREGARNNPHIDRPDPMAASRARARKKKESDKQMNDHIRSTLTNMREKGRLSGSQYHEYMKVTE